MTPIKQFVKTSATHRSMLLPHTSTLSSSDVAQNQSRRIAFIVSGEKKNLIRDKMMSYFRIPWKTGFWGINHNMSVSNRAELLYLLPTGMKLYIFINVSPL